MKNTFKILILLVCATLQTYASAAELDLEYPELLVTPSASERLLMEAKDEKGFGTNITYQIPAVITLFSGFTLKSNRQIIGSGPLAGQPDGKGHLLALGVGAGWLATTLLMDAMYRPYHSGWKNIEKLPYKTKKEKLTRERLAEESIEYPAWLARRLNFLFFVSNIATNFIVVTQARDGSTALASGIVGMASSFLPLMFKHHWQRTASEHQMYKKKIYGPVASVSLLNDQSRQDLIPGIQFQLAF